MKERPHTIAGLTLSTRGLVGHVYGHRHFAANTLIITGVAATKFGIPIVKGLWEGCFNAHYELLTLVELDQNWKITSGLNHDPPVPFTADELELMEEHCK